MADFLPITACNGPRLKDHDKVEEIIRTYFLDPELSIGVSFDHDTGEPSLFLYGYIWPEAWKVPEDVKHEDFDPYTGEQYEDGADGFIGLLKEIAPYLGGAAHGPRGSFDEVLLPAVGVRVAHQATGEEGPDH